jgi:hypothetical protein
VGVSRSTRKLDLLPPPLAPSPYMPLIVLSVQPSGAPSLPPHIHGSHERLLTDFCKIELSSSNQTLGQGKENFL